MGKAFKTKNGGLAPHPDDRNVSARLRHKLYINDHKCKLCKSSSLRFTKSDVCMMCQRFKIELVRYYFKHRNNEGHVPWPEGVPIEMNNNEVMGEVAELLKMLPNNTLHYEPCTPHGHVRISDNSGNSCMLCKTQLKPRDQAIKDGHDKYVSSSKCPSCNDITLRNTDDKSCTQCGYNPVKVVNDQRETPDSMMMREQPDMVISKSDAESYGFKVYRTGEVCTHGHKGWRYISTGNCITCLRSR